MIRWYTYHGDRIMNSALRQGKLNPLLLNRIETITTEINRAPRYPFEVTVFRGFSGRQYFPESGKPTNYILSASTSLNRAFGFSESDCCVMIIRLPPGFHILYLREGVSNFPWEQEIILPVGTLFYPLQEGLISNKKYAREYVAVMPSYLNSGIFNYSINPSTSTVYKPVTPLQSNLSMISKRLQPMVNPKLPLDMKQTMATAKVGYHTLHPHVYAPTHVVATKMDSIPASTFKEELTDLNLSNNKIKQIPSDIKHSYNLSDLKLNKNKLTSLPPEIGELTNLEYLELSDNKLTSLPPEVANLTNLKFLGLSDNELTSFPPEIPKLTNLQELELRNTNLLSLPPEIGNLVNLIDLLLSDNKLTSLPPEIGKLVNLTTLVLSKNRLTSLPPEIGKLVNLKILSVSDNQLTSLPPEIENLVNLKTLILSKNRFTLLPPEIRKFVNLTVLDVSNNYFKTFPSEVWEFVGLISLEISRSRLSSLPPEIGNLTNLAELNVSNNQLTSLPPEIRKLVDLTDLDVSNNNLVSLPPEIGELPNLSWCNAKYNRILSVVNLKDIPNFEAIELIPQKTHSKIIISNKFYQNQKNKIKDMWDYIMVEDLNEKTNSTRDCCSDHNCNLTTLRHLLESMLNIVNDNTGGKIYGIVKSKIIGAEDDKNRLCEFGKFLMAAPVYYPKISSAISNKSKDLIKEWESGCSKVPLSPEKKTEFLRLSKDLMYDIIGNIFMSRSPVSEFMEYITSNLDIMIANKDVAGVCDMMYLVFDELKKMDIQ